MKRTAALALIIVLSIPPVCDIAGQIEAARAAPPAPGCCKRVQLYRTYAEYWRANGNQYPDNGR